VHRGLEHEAAASGQQNAARGIGFDRNGIVGLFFLADGGAIDVGVMALLGVDAEPGGIGRGNAGNGERQARSENGGNKQVRARIAEVVHGRPFPFGGDDANLVARICQRASL
jgi:hypothetical protein